jgi:hypothetical protein
VARNLAAHLLAIRDVDVARRVLDDAARDAATLEAPADWWELVAREYETRAGAGEENQQIRQIILSKAGRVESGS